MSFPLIDYQSPFKKSNEKISSSRHKNLSSKKIPIPKNVFEYNKQRWQAHEKELDLIQKQFKPKLSQLQKMLIVNKANDQVDSAKDSIIKPVLSQKKLKLFLSNENKQIQRDVLIENQMKKLSSLYEFGNMNYDESEDYQTKRITTFIDQILNNLRNEIVQKESYIENNFYEKPASSKEIEYHGKVEELQDLRTKQQQLESVLMNIQKKDYQQIQPNNIQVDETSTEIPKIETRRIIENSTPSPTTTPVIDLEKEYMLKLQKKRQEFEKKVSDRVQKERQKIGVFQYKNVMSMSEINKYIKEQNEIAMAPLPSDITRLKEKQQQKLQRKLTRKSQDQKKISIFNSITHSTRSNQTSVLKEKDNLTLPILNSGELSKLIESREEESINHKLKIMSQLNKINQSYKKLPEQLSLQNLLNKCSEVQKGIKTLDRKIQKREKGQINSLNKLNNQLEVIKVSNFLENKMILI